MACVWWCCRNFIKIFLEVVMREHGGAGENFKNFVGLVYGTMRE